MRYIIFQLQNLIADKSPVISTSLSKSVKENCISSIARDEESFLQNAQDDCDDIPIILDSDEFDNDETIDMVPVRER